MAGYIYGKKDNVHIIDLQQTYPMLYTALNAAKEIAANGGKVLFVGTKDRLRTSLRKTPKDADSTMSTTAGSAAC